MNMIEIIRNNIVKGDFTLSSGKKSNYYLDSKKITLNSQSLLLASTLLLNMILKYYPKTDSIGGTELGSIPITAAILTLCAQQNIPMKGFIVRKQHKVCMTI